ncbi:hypothetical protein OROHE_005715 [Orobanche hederae]
MGSFANDDALLKVLEDELMDVGERLFRLPSSNVGLLILLEEAESILVRVPQDLPRSKADSLFPVMSAMITDELFRHADVNIQVAVASCLNEITRITTPTFPYSDDQMKEIFHLFMVALKQLSSESASNYVRAQLILETLATVRSCLIMLDLEVDAMIVEMFRLFFNTIRSNHSSDIFKYMETIMTIIIEESDDVPLDLLKALLDSVRMDNKQLSPASWELGKIVFEKCANKLEPYLRQALKQLNLEMDDYAEIVSFLCEAAPNGQNMLVKAKGAPRRYRRPSPEAQGGRRSTRLTEMTEEVSTRIVEAEQEDYTHKVKDRNESYNKNPSENSTEIVHLKDNYATINNEVVNSAEIMQPEKDPHAQQRKRGKKPNSLLRLEEGYEHTWKRGGQGSSEVSFDSGSKEKDLILALEFGNENIWSDYLQKNCGSDNKVNSDRRGRSKNQESTSGGLSSERKDGSRDVAEKMVESPISNSAPKREETSNRSNVEYGEELVNSRVMVWWPLDEVFFVCRFYTGTVEAFDSLTNKHKIKYDDEEEEVLNLREERWEMFDEQPRQVQSSRKQESDHPSSAKGPVKQDLGKESKKKGKFIKETACCSLIQKAG